MAVCLNCSNEVSDNALTSFHRDRRKGLPGDWRLVECDVCGILFMEPMPTEEQLARYYAAYSTDGRIDLSQKSGSHYPKFRKLFHWLSGDVDPRDFVQISDGARVLDYGCGHATYLSYFHDRGVSISGAEIAEYVVEACQNKGYDVHRVSDISCIPFADDEFEIIYLMQVFEHLRNPHEFMKELARIIKSDGMLYVAVPNSASIWRKVFGVNWVSGWFAPFHLFHYNREVLDKLASKYGFEVMESWSSTPESWFRLNLKACFYPKENKLDWYKCWLDSLPIRYLLMCVLRVVELPFRERDCLVMKFKKL